MNAIIATGKKLYQLEIWVLEFFKHPFLLLPRLYFGWGFIIAGLGKLENVEAQTAIFKDLHIPMPMLNVYLAGTTETVCGALLMIGFASRIITIPLIVTMIVAYMTAHKDEFMTLADCNNVWPMFVKQNLAIFIKQPPFPYLFTCLVVLLFGPGYLSVDGVLKWLLSRRHCPTEGAAHPVGAVSESRNPI